MKMATTARAVVGALRRGQSRAEIERLREIADAESNLARARGRTDDYLHWRAEEGRLYRLLQVTTEEPQT